MSSSGQSLRSSPDDAAPLWRTFVIADIRGYTSFTHARGDAAAARLTKKFGELALDAVEARNGLAVEERGDEFLAVFESSTQAVRATLEMQATYREESAADPELPLRVGIGIEAGEAVPVRDDYRGEPLNMAARLCSIAAAGQVLVTRTVAKACEETNGEVSFIEHGPTSLKGFEQPVEVFEAVARLTGAGTASGACIAEEAGLPPELDPLTPLVDRQHEMRWLRGSWRQVRRGHGRVLFISGPSLIGKTRLAGEFAETVRRERGAVRYAGSGGSATATALSAVHEMLDTSVPTLLVLDDLDTAGPVVVEALSASVEELFDNPVLILALLRDPGTSPEWSAAVEKADERGDAHRVLAPLDVEGVREIVRLYVGDDVTDAPIESMARASAGLPGRVHERANEWAHSEASRRLGAAAAFLAASRDRHASDLKFVDNVIGMKLSRLYSVADHDQISAECPYKGLATFEAGDSANFFGRERLVGELAARIVQVGLLGVVGASGSGKSSVLAAGLLPSLRAGLLPGSERWTEITMRPGEHPMVALGSALSTTTKAPVADGCLSAVLETISDESRLVLVVDQFEETFTTCTTDEERTAFIAALTEAATQWPTKIAVVLAIRGDFYAHCAPYPELAAALAANHVLVGPLTREELRRAIELPARRVGLRVESALVDVMVEEVAGEPGGLPLLSTALFELWQDRRGGWITMTAYEKSGGVRGAVARLAESSYEQLSDGERAATRRMFLRLVLTGDSGTEIRRRVPLDELDLERDPDAATVLDRLTRDRLLTTAESTVEVAHEALLREWPRLQEWLDEDKQGRQLRDHLSQASRQWRSGGEEASDLYRGARLSAVLEWAREHGPDLNELEHEFLIGSAPDRRAGVRTATKDQSSFAGSPHGDRSPPCAGTCGRSRGHGPALTRPSGFDRRESRLGGLERPGARR